MKRCIDCQEEKELGAFYTRKDGYLGRQSRCKKCQDEFIYKWRSVKRETDGCKTESPVVKRAYMKYCRRCDDATKWVDDKCGQCSA